MGSYNCLDIASHYQQDIAVQHFEDGPKYCKNSFSGSYRSDLGSKNWQTEMYEKINKANAKENLIQKLS